MFAFATSNSLQTLRRAALAGFALFLPAAASAQTILSFTPSTAAAGGTVVITDRAALDDIAEFTNDYLYLDHRPR